MCYKNRAQILRQYISVQKFQRISNKIWNPVLRRFSMCSSFSLLEQLTPKSLLRNLAFPKFPSKRSQVPSSILSKSLKCWGCSAPNLLGLPFDSTNLRHRHHHHNRNLHHLHHYHHQHQQHRHQLIINIIIMSLKCWGCTEPNLPGLTSNATKVFKTCKFSQGPITVQIFNKNLQKCQRRNLFNVEIVQLMQYWQDKTRKERHQV